MDEQRDSAWLRNESGARCVRRVAVLAVACGLLGTACADDAARTPSAQDVAALRMEQPDRDAARPTRDGELVDVDAGTEVWDALKVVVLAQLGTGCAQGVKVTDDKGHPKVNFESYDLALPPGGGEPQTKECTLRVSVTGAGAYGTADLVLTAAGNLALDSGKAELQLEESATWSGRGGAQTAKPRAWPGRQILDWRDRWRWTFEKTDTKCGGGTRSVDEVAITTKLRLTSVSSARASGDVRSLSIEARAPKSARLARCSAGF